ncbi:hypothetical protein PIB30_055029 [Stylosanthes scabra]|uniref:Uncharacterized protein n=1 Tax=Stylosanthes scabra TaxID=79078 RepID=A0ABU6SIW8_9FABA|nr:hypothetical protein [Stylosanthes scabra]
MELKHEPQVVLEAHLQACKEAEAQVQAVKKGVNAANIEAGHKPSHPQALMMAAVVSTKDNFDAPSFDLGIDSPPISPTEIYDLDDFPETPMPVPEQNQMTDDLKEKCVILTLSDKEEIRYDIIFKLRGDWYYGGVIDQFRSMREEQHRRANYGLCGNIFTPCKGDKD